MITLINHTPKIKSLFSLHQIPLALPLSPEGRGMGGGVILTP